LVVVESSKSVLRLRRIVASLYFVAVLIVMSAEFFNPDGDVSSGWSYVLTLPLSFPAVRFQSSFAEIAIVLFAGVINTVFLYVLVGKMVDWFGSRATIGILAVYISLASLPVWFIGQCQKGLVRIANSHRQGGGVGVWMATNEDGLRALSVTNGMALDSRADATTNALLFVPNQTSGITKERMFLLKSGRLVQPYGASMIDMQRDEVVEVERIKITMGPLKDREGWIYSDYLQRLLTLFSL
jgi:hypothetical protein